MFNYQSVFIDALPILRELPSSTFNFGDLMLDLCINTTPIGQDDLLNKLYEHDKNLPYNLTKAFLDYCLSQDYIYSTDSRFNVPRQYHLKATTGRKSELDVIYLYNLYYGVKKYLF